MALLDLGVNYTHPDLAANIWTNERETPNGQDDDGNGYVDDLQGWDFAYANNNPMSRPSRKFPDQFDHGTALASLMAAVPDNGIGIAGVGRNIKIMNLRVGGDPERDGQKANNIPKTLPEAIRYAIHNGARVIVCSILSLNNIEELEASLKEAEKAGILVVWAAGNHHSNIDQDRDFNLLSQFANVLIVGGTTRDGTLSPYMNFGKRVGIAAPCVDVVFPSFNGYERFKGPGTSFAAPIVAAVAATLLSQEPKLTPSQVISRLKQASVIAPGMEGKIGGGRLDVARAVCAVDDLHVPMGKPPVSLTHSGCSPPWPTNSPVTRFSEHQTLPNLFGALGSSINQTTLWSALVRNSGNARKNSVPGDRVSFARLPRRCHRLETRRHLISGPDDGTGVVARRKFPSLSRSAHLRPSIG